MLHTIAEIAPEDNLTMTPEIVVRQCSELLEDRQRLSLADTCAALKLRASAYKTMLKNDLALADAEALCKIQPQNPDVRVLRGLLRARLKNLPGAQADLEEAIRLKPRTPDYYAHLAVILFRRGNRREAMATARAALTIDSECPIGNYHAGLLSFECQQHRGCVDYLNKYLELCPFGYPGDPERPYLTRAAALSYLNRPRQALDNALIAKRLNPLSRGAAMWIVLSYIDLGKYRAAALATDDLVKLKPSKAADRFLRAEMYAKIGNKDTAQAAIRSAQAAGSETDPATAVAASRAYYELGDYTKCLECLETVLKGNPNDPAALVRKAVLQSTCPEGKYRDGLAALKVLETVDKRNVDNGEWDGERIGVMIRLADAHAECGHYDQAVELTRKVLALLPPERHRGEQEQRLKLFESRNPYRHAPSAK